MHVDRRYLIWLFSTATEFYQGIFSVVTFWIGFAFQTLYGQSECLDPTWCPLDAPRKQQLEGRVNVGPETEVIYHTSQTKTTSNFWGFLNASACV